MTERKLIPELEHHFRVLSEQLGNLRVPVHAYIAGGIAVNYHTGYRMSADVDVKWSHRVAIPPDMQMFQVHDPLDPSDVMLVTMDGNFNDTLGSFPPGWEDRAAEICRVGDIVLHVIDPVDLAVSKVARFSERDQDDIRELASQCLIDLPVFRTRAAEALDFYIGDTTFIQYNLRDAIKLIEQEIDDCHP